MHAMHREKSSAVDSRVTVVVAILQEMWPGVTPTEIALGEPYMDYCGF